jgi:hypothetical protein
MLSRVHVATFEVLNLLVSGNDLSQTHLETITLALIDNLTEAVSSANVTLQSKMLHLLSKTIISTPLHTPKTHRRSASLAEKRLSLESTRQKEPETDVAGPLAQLIVTAISSLTIAPVLQYWVDFVWVTGSIFAHRRDLLSSIGACFSGQLELTVKSLNDAYVRSSDMTTRTTLTDSEPLILIAGLERIYLILLGGSEAKKTDHGAKFQTESSSGLLGLMSNVFNVEAPATVEAVSGTLEVIRLH